MSEDPMVESREGFFRSGAAILLGVIFFGIPSIGFAVSLATGKTETQLAVFPVLLILSIVRFPRATFRGYPDRIEWSGAFGTTVIPVEDVTGVTTRWLVMGRPEAWTELLVLRTKRGKIHLDTLDEPDAVWEYLAETVWPALAARALEDLDRGRPVRLGSAKVDAKGFAVNGGEYYWDELDGLGFTKDGLLLTIEDRPHEAAVLRPSKSADLVVLGFLRHLVLERDGWPTEEDRAARPRRGAGRERPLAGLPAPHPELGDIIFTRRVPSWARLLVNASILSVLLLIAGGVAYGLGLAPEGMDEGLLFMPGGVLLGVVILFFAVTNPPTGDDFTVYDEGLAAPQGTLPWSAVDTLTLAATEHYTNGVYTHTDYTATVGGGEQVFSVSGFGAKTQAYWDWFRDKLAPILAQRDVDRVSEGGEVAYDFVTMDQEGLRWAGGNLSWDEMHSFNAQQGWLYLFSHEAEKAVHSVELSAPNAHVFYLILQLMAAHYAEEAEYAEAEEYEDAEEYEAEEAADG
jgi:hypothetical protein